MKLKSILAFVALSHISISNAAEYRLHSCDTEKSFDSCKKSCKKTDSIYEFKINPDKQIVLKIMKDDNGRIKSNYLSNCKVVDRDNWRCELDLNVGPEIVNGVLIHSSYTIKTEMTNGELIEKSSSIIRGKFITSLTCGIKKSWFNF